MLVTGSFDPVILRWTIKVPKGFQKFGLIKKRVPRRQNRAPVLHSTTSGFQWKKLTFLSGFQEEKSPALSPPKIILPGSIDPSSGTLWCGISFSFFSFLLSFAKSFTLRFLFPSLWEEVEIIFSSYVKTAENPYKLHLPGTNIRCGVLDLKGLSNENFYWAKSVNWKFVKLERYFAFPGVLQSFFLLQRDE